MTAEFVFGAMSPYSWPAAMRLAFLEGVDLGDAAAIEAACARTGLDAGWLRVRIESPEVERALRERTGAAVAAGVIGVPTVITPAGLFWGHDRLEEAAAAAGAGG